MDFGSLFGGAAEVVTGDLQKREQNAFNLKLMNAKIESELQSKKDYSGFEQNQNTIPTNQLTSLMNQAHDHARAAAKGDEAPKWDLTDITHPLAQKAALLMQEKEHSARAGGHFQKMNIGGKEVLIKVGDDGSYRQVMSGLNANSSHELNKAEVGYAKYTANLADISQSLKSFITAEDASGIPGQAMNVSLDKYLQTNPKVKAYLDQKALMAMTNEIALTGSARAVAALGVQAGNAFPNPKIDTVGTALAKMDNLEKVGRHMMDANYETFSVAPKDQKYPNKDALTQQGPSAQDQSVDQFLQGFKSSRSKRLKAA